MTDDEFLTEMRRRLADDPGAHYDWYEVLRDFDLCVDDLEPDGPQRLWVLTDGNWGAPGTPHYRAKGQPLAFLGGDEYGNRTACLRLPGKRLLVLNLGWPMSRTPWEPTGEDV